MVAPEGERSHCMSGHGFEPFMKLRTALPGRYDPHWTEGDEGPGMRSFVNVTKVEKVTAGFCLDSSFHPSPSMWKRNDLRLDGWT